MIIRQKDRTPASFLYDFRIIPQQNSFVFIKFRFLVNYRFKAHQLL